MNVARLRAENLATTQGWRSPAFVDISATGDIAAIHDRAPDAWRGLEVTSLDGFVIPGLPNLHSHAFQRAMGGHTETWTSDNDDFWSWRNGMYRLAEAVTPEEHEAIATQLFVEMLEAGMTSVGEFHYLHHDLDGRPYADRAEMSRRLISAAKTAGIGLTLLPVLYLRGGFDKPPLPSQRRFVHKDADDLLRMIEAVTPEANESGVIVGVAPHSLRAVDPASLARIVEGIRAGVGPEAPIHIHVAEQVAEVEQCLARLGSRPVAFLLDQHPLDRRWTLVHATHLDEGERTRLAQSGAIAGLCPTTEANLGDGLFPAREYLAAGGAWGVGSDSHASIDATEELRLLEYGQRLMYRRRNVLGHAEEPRVGARLWAGAVQGGATALGRSIHGIAVGARADLLALDPEHPRLIGHGTDTVLDAFIFGGAREAIADVIAGGRHVVQQHRHLEREKAQRGYTQAIERLLTSRAAT